MITRIRTFIGNALIDFFWKRNCRLMPMYNERVCEYPFVISRLQLRPGCTILDCGSANDLLIPFICSLGYKTTGIDIAAGPDVAFVARYPNYRFIQADLRNIPLPDNSFDIAICVSTLEHTFEPGGSVCGDIPALREIIRVTRPGGQVIFTSPYGKGEINTAFPERPHKVFDEKLLNEFIRFSEGGS